MRHPTLATLLFALAQAASSPAAAHLPGMGVGSLVVTRDQATGTRAYGLESNAAVLIFNAGLSLRQWENEITGWNGRRLHNEATVYVGLGLANFIQLQRGFSNGGARSRFRVDLPFVSEQEKWGRFAKGIVISPFVETGSGKKAYGVGIGVAYF